MFCRFCGNEVADSAKFCTRCGKPIKKIEPAQAVVTPAAEQKPVDPAPVREETAAQPAPQPSYTPDPEVKTEPAPQPTAVPAAAEPTQESAPIYAAPEAPASESAPVYTAPAAYAEPAPKAKKEKKAKKEGKKSKKGLLIAIIIVAVLAVAAVACVFFLGGNKIEISDEAVAAIAEKGGFNNEVAPFEIVSAKVMSTVEENVFGIDMKDEHVRIKIENEFVTVETCYVIGYYKQDGKWIVDNVKEYNKDDCGHGGFVMSPKADLDSAKVEADVRAYFEDEDMVCSRISIPEPNEYGTVTVTLTVHGTINGRDMWANVEASFYPDAVKGWYIVNVDYEEIDKPADGGADDGSDIEELPDADTEGTPSTNPDGTTDRVPDPDQPVSDEKALEDFLSNPYNLTNPEIVTSGYNFDGSYTFLISGTDKVEYSLVEPINYLEMTYVPHNEESKENESDWYCRTWMKSFVGFKDISPLLGTWMIVDGIDSPEAYTLEIKEVRLEDPQYGFGRATIVFDFICNGKTTSFEHIGYFRSGSYASLELGAGSFSDYDFKFVTYPIGEGQSGWYVDGICLKKVDPDGSTQTGTTTQIKASDLVGKWAYLSPSSDEISETSLTFDNNGNFDDISYPYAWINEDGEGEVAKGPIEGIEGTYSISKTADNSTNLILYRPAGIGRYDEYYPEYTRTYQIIDFSPKSRLTIKNLENGKTYTYYYSGNETSGYLNIPELAEKQGIDVPPELYIPIYERFN